MRATLCAINATAHWVLCDDLASKVAATLSFCHQEQSSLGTMIAAEFEALLNDANIKRNEITSIATVSGPGAFTGLRMSAAFTQGLAAGLNIPLIGIATFDVVGQVFYLPLRHTKAPQMSLSEYLAASYEFLKVSSRDEFEVANPTQNDLVFGIQGSAFTIEPKNILAGLRRQLQNPSPFKICYGLEPKIFGVRAQTTSISTKA